MADVAHQAIRDVERGVRQLRACQRAAERDARSRQVHALRRQLELGRRERNFGAVAGQRQARVAQGAGDPDVVAGLGGVAPQGLAGRQFAEDGDADGERALGGVAADQFAVEFIGQLEQAAREPRQPARVGLWQRQRQRERDRFRAHRGQVRQVHRQAFVAQHARIGAGKKVAALDQHVGRNRHLHAGGGGEQRAVVADAERGARRARADEVLLDQVEFGEHGQL